MGAQAIRAKPDAKSSTVSRARVEPATLSHATAFEQTRPDHISSRLQGGSPLPLTTRDRMERSFGRSFNDVRVHTGAVAKDVTQAQSAEALTVDQKIAFAPGQFRPGTASGDHLIAHELAHVVQQSAGGGHSIAQAHSITSVSSESAEIAADQAADRAVQGKSAGLVPTGLSTRGRIMRRARAGGSSLPAMTVAPPVPGFGQKGDVARSLPSSVTTGLLSPAGNQLAATVGDAPARAAPRPNRGQDQETPTPQAREAPNLKGPDETQTPQAQTEASPPSVAVAGASAGAAPTDAQNGGTEAKAEGASQESAKKKKEKDKEKLDEQEKDQEKRKEAAKEEAGEAKAKKKRKFGQIPGDRGAGAARAAAARLTNRAVAMQHHEPSGQRINDARAAAAPPANEGQSRAQGDQVGTVAAAEAPPPEPETARQDVRAAVEDAAPANMEEMDQMGSDAGSQEIQSTLSGVINAQVQGVRGTLDAVNNPPPATEPPPPVPQPEPEVAPGTPAPNLADAAPPPVPDATLDASEFQEEAENALNSQDIDDETLSRATDGPLKTLAEDKASLDQQVEQSASDVRTSETPALTEATSSLENQEGTAQGEMGATREGQQQQVLGEQDTTRTTEETERQTASDQIQGIYTHAAEEVNGRLDGLTEQSTQQFDDRQRQYLEDFSRDTRSELDDFKDERYSGPLGWTDWIADRFISINELPAVKAIYQRNRDRYIQRIDLLISEITADIDQTITECKQTLEAAKQEIQTLVDNLPASLQEEARAAQQRVEQQFAQLEQRIDQAAESARNALQERRQQAIEAVDRALAEIQAENEALLDKIANFVNQLVELLGKFLQLMTRITRMGIGSFISSSLEQAEEGVRNHLWSSLQEAFKQWVFSKIPFLEPLLNLPSNWLEMLTEFVTNLPQLFMENLPQMLPNIATAAMTWLATNLAAKLIPGAGAIMAIIDGIRAAYGLVQNLFSAAEAFFGFVMKVAQPAFAAVDFANALARGIVAGLDAILTFLGVDRLIMRVGGAIARPFGRIFNRIAQRFRSRRQQRTAQRQRDRDHDRRNRERDGRPDELRAANERRRARDEADRDDHRERRRREDDHRRQAQQDSRRDPRSRSDHASESGRRRDRQEREQRDRERLDRAVAAIGPAVSQLQRHGVSRLGLQARLLVWRLRYRLSGLSLQGDEVTAEINPRRQAARIRRMNNRRLGQRLERILVEAERQYFRQRYEEQPELLQQVEAAQEEASRSFPGQEIQSARQLEDPERVTLIRQLLSQPGQLPLAFAPASPLMRSLFRRNRPASGVVLPGRRGGDIRVQHPAHGSLIHVPDAPAYSQFRQGDLSSEAGQALLDVGEPARAEGQFATREVARALVERGDIEGMEAATGRAAAMRATGSARAADEDFRGREPATRRSTRRQTERARASRFEGTGTVFQELAGVLRRETSQIELFADPEQTAIEELAQAFRNWAITNLSRSGRRSSTPEQRRATEAALIASLIAFLRTRTAVGR